MKQQRLYELQPIPEPQVEPEQQSLQVEHFAAVEYLDDAVLETPEASVQPEVIARRKKRKCLSLRSAHKPRDKQQERDVEGKLSCKVCGIFLSTKVSLKRHIDRVSRTC